MSAVEEKKDLAPFEVVTKLKAAERQLCVAIRLFFERKDTIAVHALAANAQDVLRMLGRPRGIKGIYDEADTVIRPEFVKEFTDKLREAQNFFKHAAEGDPEKRLNFYYDVTKFLIFDAARLHLNLTGNSPPEISVFLAWFMAKHPQYYKGAAEFKTQLESVRGIIDLDDWGEVFRFIEFHGGKK